MSEPTSPSPGHPVYLCLGSNIDPEANLPRAVDELAREVSVRAVSPVYESEPVGASPGSPRFLNAAVAIATELSPGRLKETVLRPIEERLGRVRGADPNAPRTIDLDIALYDDLVLEDTGRGIVLPDPEILTRPHVALPLADLAPGCRHPATGETLAAIAGRFAGAPGIRRHPLRLQLGPTERGVAG